MALTRKMLSAMGIEEEKIDQIVEEHSKTVNEIKEAKENLETELQQYKAKTDKLKEVQDELKKVKSELSAIDVDGLNKRYEDLKSEYDEYKSGVEAKASHNQKVEAYRSLLLEIGVSEKRIQSIVKVSDVDSIEIGEDGKIKDLDKLTESVKSEWADFIQSSRTKGADTATPPDNTGGNTFENLSLQDKMIYANEHPDDAEVKTWLGK